MIVGCYVMLKVPRIVDRDEPACSCGSGYALNETCCPFLCEDAGREYCIHGASLPGDERCPVWKDGMEVLP
jgi:hypothetical protein